MKLLFVQHRLELKDKLFQHTGEIYAAVLKLNIRQIEPGYLEKLVDKLLQTLRLIKGYGKVLFPKFRRYFLLVPQQREISYDRGERCFQVMGEVHDKVVFALLVFFSYLRVMQRGFPGAVKLVLYAFELVRQDYLFICRICKAFRRGNYLVKIPQRAAHEEIGDYSPAGNKRNGEEEYQKSLHEFKKLVHRVIILPVELPYKPVSCGEKRKKRHSKYHQRQNVLNKDTAGQLSSSA